MNSEKKLNAYNGQNSSSNDDQLNEHLCNIGLKNTEFLTLLASITELQILSAHISTLSIESQLEQDTKVVSSGSSDAYLVLPNQHRRRTLVERIYRHPRQSQPLFTINDGIISVNLHHNIRLDITVDNAIRVISCSGQIIISLCSSGDLIALTHPNGLIQQFGNFTQLVVYDGSENNIIERYANFTSDGIIFTSSNTDDVFLIDANGTRKSFQQFPKIPGDNTSAVFLGKARYGAQFNEEAFKCIQDATVKKCSDNVTDLVCVNGYRIWQMEDGFVNIYRNNLPFKLRTSPKNLSLALDTPNIHCTASLKDSRHLFIRVREQSLHFDGKNFLARYNRNTAGFQEDDYLVVY